MAICTVKPCDDDPCATCEQLTARVHFALAGEPDDIDALIEYMTSRAREWNVEVLETRVQ